MKYLLENTVSIIHVYYVFKVDFNIKCTATLGWMCGESWSITKDSFNPPSHFSRLMDIHAVSRFVVLCMHDYCIVVRFLFGTFGYRLNDRIRLD